MGFTQTDAKFLGKLALGYIGLVLDQFKQSIADFVDRHVLCSFVEQGGMIRVQGERGKVKLAHGER